MALEAPLRSSTGSLISPFSPHTDISMSSPDSPSMSNKFISMSSSGDPQSLRPNYAMRAHSAYLMSPNSDIGPSPVTSNGTETTEIEDEVAEEHELPLGNSRTGLEPQLMMLKTNIPDHVRQSGSEEAVSVIHAPQSFEKWATGSESNPSQEGSRSSEVAVPSSSEGPSQEPQTTPNPPPISTNVKPVRFSIDAATPQAQNLQEVLSDPSRLRSSSASSLEQIPEIREVEMDAEYESEMDPYGSFLPDPDTEVKALRTALEECWTLCNTLATLSSIHRERIFNSSGTPDAHEKAWKSCWKLCQRLYNSRDEEIKHFNAMKNLDLCRDFCQALFDVRQRKDEVADSVLRVSFELNNHLYSAQDNRNLPEAFRERTLDFYITLCHRLMKQRSEMVEETDSLLQACWSLAEMLFSLRQNKRDNKPLDEELLGSAVQACWELCDIFREGWTQVRPDRGTPRPSQLNFSTLGTGGSDTRSNTGSRASMHSKRESLKALPEDRPRKHTQPIPETPVTEFEDTPISPESSSPQMPNILVLGTNPESSRGSSTGVRWSSAASNMSGYSVGSTRTSSTATTATSAEDINITRIKTLIVKAAMNVGFNRDSTDNHGGAASLQTFVKSLPPGSFGSLSSHATLLQNYKNLVVSDSSFRASATLPPRGRRVLAADVAKSVGWMMLRSGQYGFLRDLFKLVFGFQLEEAENRKNVSIAI